MISDELHGLANTLHAIAIEGDGRIRLTKIQSIVLIAALRNLGGLSQVMEQAPVPRNVEAVGGTVIPLDAWRDHFASPAAKHARDLLAPDPGSNGGAAA